MFQVLYLYRTIIGEHIKLKSTIVFWVLVLCPLINSGLYFLLFLINGVHFIKEGTDPWVSYVNGTTGFWAVIVYPLYIGLISSLISGIDHVQDNWKYLYSLPLPKWCHYFAKSIILHFYVLVGLVLLVAFIFITGKLLGVLKPAFGFFDYDAPDYLFILPFKVILASFFILALHHWLGMYFKNFFLSMGITISLTVMNIIIINNDLRDFYPWSYPAAVSRHIITSGYEMADTLTIISVLSGLILTFLGYQGVKGKLVD